MTTSPLSSAFLSDPMVILELLALLLTLIFLVKTTIQNNLGCCPSDYYPEFSAQPVAKQSNKRSAFWSLIAVGGLISLPKRSLKGQRKRH